MVESCGPARRSAVDGRRTRHLLTGCALAVLIMPTVAFAQAQPQPASQPPQADDQGQSKDIIVTGIRSALASALKEKKNAPNIVEIIQAEKIGKLPDQNLAEVLENVTGIQITRVAGVGTGVQIRGTDANRTEINGVSTVGNGAGRSGISFDDIPASIISSVEVTKVSTAQTIEGSVGGTINLRTIRPLDLKKPLLSVRIQGEYSDITKTKEPRLSATIGDRWNTSIGEIGIVLSGSYSRQDVSEINPRVDRDNVNIPGSGPSSQSFKFLQIQFLQQGVLNYKYRTIDLTGTLEWKPAPNLRFYFDTTFNNQKRAQNSYRAQLSGVSGVNVINGTNNQTFETVDLGSLVGPNGSVDYGNVQAVTSGTLGVSSTGTLGPILRTSTDTGSRITHSRIYDFGFDWHLGSRLTVQAQAALSTAKTTSPNFSTTLDFVNPNGTQPAIGQNLANGVPLAFDLRNGALTFGINNASPLAPTAAQLLNPANYRLNQVVLGNNAVDNKEKAARFDLVYDTSTFMPFLKSIQAGYRWSETTSVNNVFSNSVSYTNTTTAWNRPAGNLFADVLTSGPSNFNSVDGRTLYLPNFLLVNGDLAFSNPSAVLASLNAGVAASNAAKTVGPNAVSLGAPTESAAGFFSITERTNALYAQANFDTKIGKVGVAGNLGLRFVSTKLSSIGNNVQNGTNLGQILNASSYKFFLPRFNLVITPTSNVLVRVGIARDIRRPNFDTVSTSASFSTGANTPVTVGNPGLVPEQVWSFDLSGEYYFGKASLISVGLFKKVRTNLFATSIQFPPDNAVNGQLNISIDPSCPGGGIYNPIAVRNINNPVPGTGICVPISSTFNVPGTTTQTGIEVGFQHDLSNLADKIGFASGFGFAGNFTFQKTGGSARSFFSVNGPRNVFTALGYPNAQSLIGLVNLSKFAYNVTVFYDKHGLNARMRYTWRSSFQSTDACSQCMGIPLIYGARGQLNASINYDVTPFFNIGIEGINLTRSDQKEYCVNDKALLCFQGLTDRRITAGATLKF